MFVASEFRERKRDHGTIEIISRPLLTVTNNCCLVSSELFVELVYVHVYLNVYERYLSGNRSAITNGEPNGSCDYGYAVSQ